jgi:hypothetical protein
VHRMTLKRNIKRQLALKKCYSIPFPFINWLLRKCVQSCISKKVRRIYGPVKDNDQWRIRYNKEFMNYVVNLTF